MQYVIIPHKSDRVCLVHSGMNGRKHPLGKDELMHYRTPNSVNGVRRYQNKDGSLTPLGRIHYGIEHPREWYSQHAKELEKQGQAQGEKAAREANKDWYNRNRPSAGYKSAQTSGGSNGGGGGAAPQTPKVQPQRFTFSSRDSQKATSSTPASRQAAAQQTPKTQFTFGKYNGPSSTTANQNNSSQPVTSAGASAPSFQKPADKLDELRKKTESLYNLNGTKKTDSSAVSKAQNDPDFGNKLDNYMKNHPELDSSYKTPEINLKAPNQGPAWEELVKNGVNSVVDWTKNTAAPNTNAFLQGLTGNQAEVRRQQDMQRTGMPNNAPAALAGQQVNQTVGNAVNGAGQVLGDVGKAVTGVVNGAGQGISDLWNNTVVPTAQNVSQAVTGAVNGAGQGISDLWNKGIVPTAQNTWNTVSGAASDAGQNTNAFLQGLAGNQAEVRRQQDMQRTGMPNNAAAALAGQQVNQTVGNAVNGAGQVLGDVGKAVTGAVNGAGQFAGDTFRNVQSFVNNEAIPEAKKALSNAEQFVNQTVAPGAQAAVQNTGNALQNAWNGLTGWLGTAAQDVGNAVTGAVNGAGQGISDFWNNTVAPTAQNVGSAVAGAVNGAGQGISDLWNNTIVPTAQNVGQAVTGAVNDTGKWISNAVNDVGQFAQGAYNGFVGGDANPVKWNYQRPDVDPDSLNGYNLGTGARQLIDNVGGTVTGLINGAGQGISDLWNRGVVPTAANVGSNVSGFVQGALGNVSPEEYRLQQHLQRGGAPNNVAAMQAGNAVNNAVNGVANGAKDVWNNTVVPTAQNAWNTASRAVGNAGKAVSGAANDVSQYANGFVNGLTNNRSDQQRENLAKAPEGAYNANFVNGQSAGNDVRNTVKNVTNAVTGGVNSAGQAIGNAAENVSKAVNNNIVPAAYGAASNAGLAPKTLGNVPGGTRVAPRQTNVTGSANPLQGIIGAANAGDHNAQQLLSIGRYYASNPNAPIDYATYKRMLDVGYDLRQLLPNPIMDNPYERYTYQDLQNK